MCLGKYKWSRSRFVVGVLAQFVTVIGFTGWALYLWFHVKDYGSQNTQSGCNDRVIYVLMFVSIRATKPWLRDSWIAVIIASAVGLLIRFGTSAFYRFAREEGGERGGGGEEGGGEEGEGKKSDEGWYFSMSILPLLYVISLSPPSHAHQSPLRWAIYATVMLELLVSYTLTSTVASSEHNPGTAKQYIPNKLRRHCPDG